MFKGVKDIVEAKNTELSAWTVDNYPKSRTITDSMMNKCVRESMCISDCMHMNQKIMRING